MKHFTLPKDGGLIEKGLPQDVLHSYERIRTEIFSDSTQGSEVIADKVIAAIKKFQAEGHGRKFKLGLTTGTSPVSLYKWFFRRYSDGVVSFKDVEVFSLDEYYPLVGPELSRGRNRTIFSEFIDKVDVNRDNVHLPCAGDGADVSRICEEYEKMVRGLDFLIMGVGENGQVGFNEAGSAENSRTRLVRLSYKSRKRQSANFSNVADTPEMAITMGIDTMASAKEIILLAWGENKAEAVKAIVEDPIKHKVK